MCACASRHRGRGLGTLVTSRVCYPTLLCFGSPVSSLSDLFITTRNDPLETTFSQVIASRSTNPPFCCRVLTAVTRSVGFRCAKNGDPVHTTSRAVQKRERPPSSAEVPNTFHLKKCVELLPEPCLTKLGSMSPHPHG